MMTMLHTLLSLLLLTICTLRCFAAEVPILFFYGTLLDDAGGEVSGAQVQFWHTDYHGNYDHPGNPYNGYDLVSDFQYYGTAETDDRGRFQFTTFRPGIYPSRPISHIHFKVFLNGKEVLTSQFYFADERPLFDPMLVLNLADRSDGNIYTAKTIVVDLGRKGTRKTTPPQQEGPFYPVVRFFDMGPDVTEGIGEYGTIFPTWQASGTWFPTGTTEFPTTFAPTEGEETLAPTPSPVTPTNPPTEPPEAVATNTTTAPVVNTTSPTLAPTAPPTTNATKTPTFPSTTNATNAPPTNPPTLKPTSPLPAVPPTTKPTNAPQTPPPTVTIATQPPLLTNSTNSTQETVIGSNATAPTSAPIPDTTQVFPTSAPEDSKDDSKDDKPQKEKMNSVTRRMLRRVLHG